MDTPTAVVTVGADLLAAAVEAQAVPVTRVDWRPPMPGTEDDLVAVATDPLPRRRQRPRARGDARASRRRSSTWPRPRRCSGSSAGSSCTPARRSRWDRAPGPLRGALMGGAALEGLVDDPEDAVALFESGTSVSPRAVPPPRRGRPDGRRGHPVDVDVGAGGPARPGGGRYCSLNEGLGKVLRYGAYGPDVLTRLRWMGDVLGPLLQAAVRSTSAARVPST